MSEAQRLPNTVNLAFVEGLYLNYLKNPLSVPPEWRAYFDQLSKSDRDNGSPRLGPSFHPPSIFNPSTVSGNGGFGAREAEVAAMQNRVDELIRNYRVRGHMIAAIDPLKMPRPRIPELEPEFYAFSETEMNRRFSCDTLCDGAISLREILERLRNTYCRSIGVQFMHIDELAVRHCCKSAWSGRKIDSTLAARKRFASSPGSPTRSSSRNFSAGNTSGPRLSRWKGAKA